MIETTALGAAGLAGITLGVWSGTAAVPRGTPLRPVRAASTDLERAARRAGWQRAVHAALAWARFERGDR